MTYHYPIYSSVFEPSNSSVTDTSTSIGKKDIDSSPTFASFHAVAIKKIYAEYKEILKVTEEMVNVLLMYS